MEYFRIHAKRLLLWAVLGIGLIIALGLGSQIIDSIFTPSECVLDRCNLGPKKQKRGIQHETFQKTDR